MKPLILFLLSTALASMATAQSNTPSTNLAAPPAGATNQAASVQPVTTAASAAVPATASITNAAEPPITSESGTNGLRINFHGAPLNLVLDYLSDAAGFIINKTADVHGTVEVWSKQPVTKDEAVDLLSSVLSKNG